MSSHSKSKIVNTRFLVAKYIPDMRRLEPLNIGVIVWLDGHLSARFLGEQPVEQGVVRPPRRLGIHSASAYSEWIQYWRSQMSSETLSVNGNGQRVARESPRFLEALQQRSKQNFVLVDGGFISGEVSPTDIDDVVNDLFAGLVEEEDERRETHAEDAILLKKSVARILKESGIDRMPGYSAKLPLVVSVESHSFVFTFDSAIYTNAPQALFQHALLTRPMTVNSAAFMFSCLARADYRPYQVPKNHCFSLVRTSRVILDSEPASKELEKLKAYSTIIDVADEERSINELRQLSFTL